MKTREKLIHLLGGKTLHECQRARSNGIRIGKLQSTSGSLMYAQMLTGLNDDEWRQKMMEHLTDELSKL